MSGPRPAHLSRRGAVYRVRFRIPEKLAERRGVIELVGALHTVDPKELNGDASSKILRILKAAAFDTRFGGCERAEVRAPNSAVTTDRLLHKAPPVDGLSVNIHMLHHGNGFLPGFRAELPSQGTMIPTKRRKAARRNRARDVSQSLRRTQCGGFRA